MADLSITASAVLPGTNAQTTRGIAAETITAGQLVFRDSSNSNLITKTDVNASGKQTVHGIALCGASAGQPVVYATVDDDLTLFASSGLTVGILYVLSGTAGGIAPAADLATGLTGIFVGVAKSATKLNFNPTAGGVVA